MGGAGRIVFRAGGDMRLPGSEVAVQLGVEFRIMLLFDAADVVGSCGAVRSAGVEPDAAAMFGGIDVK